MCAKDSKRTKDRGRVLSPKDLDFEEHDEVIQLDDGRYLISMSGDGPPDPLGGKISNTSSREWEPSDQLTAAAVRTWLTESLTSSERRYGFEVAMKCEDEIEHIRYESDDVALTFGQLLQCYAAHVDSSTPRAEALGILLAETDVPVDYPSLVIQQLLERHGLAPDDSIRELIDAVAETGG